MTQILPYLTFNGNAEVAFNFYKTIFGGEFLNLSRFKEMPSEKPIAPEDEDRIMHVALKINEETTIMASDTWSEMPQVVFGQNISLSINATSEDEASKIFNGLAEGAVITMPLEKTFWNAYFGMLTDRFGIHWMVNYDYPQEA